MKRFGLAACLMVVWIFLWGEISLANLLSGAAAAVSVLVAFPGDRPDARQRYVVRPVPFLRLAGYMLSQLARSNVLLTREMLSRTSRLHTAVIAVDIRTDSPALVTAMANLMALNPGTLAIDLAPDASEIYVHVFYLDDVETLRRDVNQLQDLIIRAFTPRSDAAEPTMTPTATT